MIGRYEASGDGSVAARDINAPVTTTVINYYSSAAVVPLDVAQLDLAPVFAAVDVAAFSGREWLIAKVDEFLANQQCGYVWVEADAGLGKTAAAAWLVHHRGYLAHFSRQSSTGPGAALQNLAAQLISRCGLTDLAQAGVVPAWATTPEGFSALLSLAATQAGTRGDRLVLVVDGLDEIDGGTKPGQLPLGLPVLLPTGVFILGTYRTGSPPRPADCPTVTLRILADDARNREDVLRYLTKTVGKEVLAKRLAANNMEPSLFIQELASQSGGVWVYLRYILTEVQVGLRSPREIKALPSRLWEYYLRQIVQWHADAALWTVHLRPVLATLGVAAEPMNVATLTRLAGLSDSSQVRRLCDGLLRPFLTVAPLGLDRQYSVYHGSFRELIAGYLPMPRDEDHPDHWTVIADELGCATNLAHSRIATCYLESFGNLGVSLDGLAADLGLAEQDGGYPLRHLASHLDQAGRRGDLHRLLACEHRLGHHTVNTWFAAHERAGTLDAYLDDIDRARRDVETATDDDIQAGRSAPTLGNEVRYALMTASVHNLANNVPPELALGLVDSGIWDSRRALLYARRLADPQRRCAALAGLWDRVADADRPKLLAEVLAAAEMISHEEYRVQALTDLAALLPDDQRHDVLTRALAVATTMVRSSSSELFRASALAGVAPHLPEDLLAEALTISAAFASSDDRVRALAGLAPYLAVDLLRQALTVAIGITDEDDRVRALAALLPYVPSDERSVAVTHAATAAATIKSDFGRAKAFALLAPYLPHDQQPNALALAVEGVKTKVLGDRNQATVLISLAPHLTGDLLTTAQSTATAINDPTLKVKALAALVPQLPLDRQQIALADAITATTTIGNGRSLAEALKTLAPLLTPEMLTPALAAIDSIGSEYALRDLYRSEAFVALAPYLPNDLLSQAMTTIATTISDDHRTKTLAILAKHVPRNSKATLLAETLADSTAIKSEYSETHALTALATFLPTTERADIMTLSLATAESIKKDSDRASALAGLAPHLPLDQRTIAVTQALGAAKSIDHQRLRVLVLIDLAPHLSGDLLAQAFAAATDTTLGEDHRVEALVGLAPNLPGDLLESALDAALSITDEGDRVRALVGLAPHMTDDMLAPALSAAVSITREYNRARAIAGLARYLPSNMIGRALAAPDLIDLGYARAEALTGLAPYLPGNLIAAALSAAESIEDNPSRAGVLADLAEHLPVEVYVPTMIAATGISDANDRMKALKALAAHMPTDRYDQAIRAAARLAGGLRRAEMVASLAPHLPSDMRPPVLTEALTAAESITDDFDRADAIVRLAPHLPHEVLTRVVAAVTTVKISSMGTLALHLSEDELGKWLAGVPSIIDERERAQALTGLVPNLRGEKLSQALVAIAAIADEEIRAGALISVARGLPVGLLSQALAAAAMIGNRYERERLLDVLTPLLPCDLLGEALKIASGTTTQILTRAQELLLPEHKAELIRLMRRGLQQTSRRHCETVVAAIVGGLDQCGEAEAVRGCVRATQDVHVWWP